MASILDSFRETFGDRLSFFKIIVFAIPIYFAYDQYLKATTDYSNVFWLLSITIFFLLGFLVKTTSGVVNERDTVMPSLNPFKLAFSAIKAIIAVGPISAISIALANYFTSIINIIPWLDITLKWIIWLIVASVCITAFLMYVKRERISDAYNLKIISERSGDLMLGLIFFLLQLVVINVPTTLFIGYTLAVLFGVGPVVYGFLAYAIVFNIIVTGHYMAQLQYEILGLDKNKFS